MMADKGKQSSRLESMAAPIAGETYPANYTPPKPMTYRKQAILVMGKAGMGKSSFIAAASGQEVPIGGGGDCCTQECEYYVVKEFVCNTQFVLIDTPGFGMCRERDLDVLHKIVDFINSEECPQISGLVYIQSINESRMTGSDLHVLNVVMALCREKFYSQVVICTSQWNRIQPKVDEYERCRIMMEALLQSEFAYGPLKANGAIHMQFWADKSSALGVLQFFASLGQAPRMSIQKKLGQDDLIVYETDAGQVIVNEAHRKAQERKNAAKRLEEPTMVDQRLDPHGVAEEGWSFRGVLGLLTRWW